MALLDHPPQSSCLPQRILTGRNGSFDPIAGNDMGVSSPSTRDWCALSWTLAEHQEEACGGVTRRCATTALSRGASLLMAV
jgi:hypothetical protein